MQPGVEPESTTEDGTCCVCVTNAPGVIHPSCPMQPPDVLPALPVPYPRLTPTASQVTCMPHPLISTFSDYASMSPYMLLWGLCPPCHRRQYFVQTVEEEICKRAALSYYVSLSSASIWCFVIFFLKSLCYCVIKRPVPICMIFSLLVTFWTLYDVFVLQCIEYLI